MLSVIINSPVPRGTSYGMSGVAPRASAGSRVQGTTTMRLIGAVLKFQNE